MSLQQQQNMFIVKISLLNSLVLTAAIYLGEYIFFFLLLLLNILDINTRVL